MFDWLPSKVYGSGAYQPGADPRQLETTRQAPVASAQPWYGDYREPAREEGYSLGEQHFRQAINISSVVFDLTEGLPHEILKVRDGAHPGLVNRVCGIYWGVRRFWEELAAAKDAGFVAGPNHPIYGAAFRGALAQIETGVRVAGALYEIMVDNDRRAVAAATLHAVRVDQAWYNQLARSLGFSGVDEVVERIAAIVQALTNAIENTARTAQWALPAALIALLAILGLAVRERTRKK